MVGMMWGCYMFELGKFAFLSVGILVSMGLLGAYDDWSKIKRRGGISARAKFIVQNLCALLMVLFWYWSDPGAAGYLWIPLFNISLFVGALIVPWAMLVIVSASNAVNLTDGLDGLAGTVLALSFGAIAACAKIMGDSQLQFCALVAAGVSLGFLWFNWHPARLFMGDTGALALGALLGLYAVQLNITLLLPFIAIVPVIETLSVILQVAWYKRYQRRLFNMAPLHHHFELLGYSEPLIARGAGFITAAGALIAALSVYL